MVEVSMELRVLADRVEALTGPDREVDQAIARAVLWRNPGTDPRLLQNEDTAWLYLARCPSYTASLDAAMTLVPEGWAIERLSYWPASPEGADNISAGQSSVTLVGTALERFGRKMVWGHSGKDGRVEAFALTPALALTAAALRARASLLDSPHTKGDEA